MADLALMSASQGAVERRVIVAGGGFAALETAVALRALVGPQLRLTLVAAEPRFFYRPLATAEAFGGAPAHSYDLRELAAGIEATFHHAAVEAVAPQTKEVRLTTGRVLSYDDLVLAVGARRRVGVPGALTFRDQRDIPQFRRVLDELERGLIRRVAFAVPSRQCWALPAYELALLTAAHGRSAELETEVLIVSQDRTPLEVFGPEASQLIQELLMETGVRFVGQVIPHSVTRTGLRTELDGTIPADRVVAVPELQGERITGIPAGWSGFVATDSQGRVEGLRDVYAAGDMTTFPIKQGGLATQQADHIAQTIASNLGLPVRPSRLERILQVRLIGGAQPLFLRAEVDALGQVSGASVRWMEPGELRGTDKVSARYLTPYLARVSPASAVAL